MYSVADRIQSGTLQELKLRHQKPFFLRYLLSFNLKKSSMNYRDE